MSGGTVLLVGAGGMLGRAFQQRFERDGVAYRALGYADLDIADAAQVREAVGAGLRVVVNCAAYTDVDGAESDEAAALRVNGEGPAHLAEACARAGVPLIHFSTDYVFSGEADAPYPVDEPLAPLNAYGRSKAAGERAVRESGCAHLILRTSWLYAPWGKNFVRTMVQLTAAKPSLRVVDDQRGRPTSAQHLAALSWRLFAKGARGTLHGTDGGACSWFELAVAVRDQCGHECHLSPCASDEFPRPAKRPAYSVLDLTATEALLGPTPHWRQHLEAVLAELRAPR